MEAIKILLITQARIGSTRLPGKVLLKINGDELLKIQLERLKKCKLPTNIVVATTVNNEDDAIESLCKDWGFKTSRGSVDDVLDRFYQTAVKENPQWVVRLTSDCPLIDPNLVDAVIALALINDVDYASNVLEEHFPDGQDVEVFKFTALEKAWKEAGLKSEREHVTPYIRNNSTFKNGSLFTSVNFPCRQNYSDIRMTVDEPRDLELITRVINDLGTDRSWITYTEHIIKDKLDHINGNIIRNEGMLKSLKND
ncbi:cytidylyltransferase domain-containing protein [Mucilaginibacter sp. AW1-3]